MVGTMVNEKNKILFTSINLFCFLITKLVSVFGLLIVFIGEFKKANSNQLIDDNPRDKNPKIIPKILIKS